MAGARLGQVFLKNSRIEQRIVEALELSREGFVLEIGAGPGNMTARLAASGTGVVAVEIDPKWADALRQRFAGRDNVVIIEGDILDVAVDDVAGAAGRRQIKVFGNVPYYITSPILLHLFRYHSNIEEIVVMVQQEVADRIVAQPGEEDYGLLSLTCQYYTRPQLLFSSPAAAFQPQPKVDSALVRMAVWSQRDALGIADEAAFWKWMRAAFAQRRKTLVNNWKSLCELEQLRSAMEQLGIDSRARAESLSLQQLAVLYRAVVESIARP
jgi:16S rRNA (adenine1518-N6/adenine1519-N6)-dimethyltransferase